MAVFVRQDLRPTLEHLADGDGGGGAQSGRDQTRAGRHSINIIALRFRSCDSGRVDD